MFAHGKYITEGTGVAYNSLIHFKPAMSGRYGCGARHAMSCIPTNEILHVLAHSSALPNPSLLNKHAALILWRLQLPGNPYLYP